jgi:hypothetical protein
MNKRANLAAALHTATRGTDRIPTGVIAAGGASIETTTAGQRVPSRVGIRRSPPISIRPCRSSSNRSDSITIVRRKIC